MVLTIELSEEAAASVLAAAAAQGMDVNTFATAAVVDAAAEADDQAGDREF